MPRPQCVKKDMSEEIPHVTEFARVITGQLVECVSLLSVSIGGCQKSWCDVSAVFGFGGLLVYRLWMVL